MRGRPRAACSRRTILGGGWLRTVGERIQQPGGLFPGDEIEPPSISFGPASAVIYRKYFDKDAALARRLQPLMVGEPSGEATLHILQGLGKRYEQHHKCVLRPIAFRPSSISASAIGNGAPIGRPLGGATVGGAIQMGDKVSIQLESGQVAFHSQRT